VANYKRNELKLWGATSLFCASMIVTGCHAKTAEDTTDAVVPVVSKIVPSNEPVGLTLSGYNYTNRYIDQFYVNGIGGGNLHVSTATSGGTNVCCFSYTPGTPAPKTVTVKWQHGACKYKETKESTYAYTHPFFKTVEVPVAPNVPAKPDYFEVHFYPDGHVEAAITEQQSGGRLHLDVAREDRSDYPRCPNDEKPKD
jgi:hypothetical protein